jgi:hypothetical protein
MAGGDTEVGGNGSVYWRARHFGRGQSKRKLKCKPNGQQHKNDEIDVDNDEALGRDADTDVTDIGDRLGQRGSFLVTLRYPTRADADAAISQAQISESGAVLVKIKVPAISRSRPNDDPPFEVKVEW